MRVEKSNFTVVRMARLLEVSRSGFYAWLKRPVSARTVRQTELAFEVTKHFAASDDVYGAPRILADLREAGEAVSGLDPVWWTSSKEGCVSWEILGGSSRLSFGARQ